MRGDVERKKSPGIPITLTRALSWSSRRGRKRIDVIPGMLTTTHILLLRHGQTEANASGRLQGHLPTSLNLTGMRQATLLAARLAAYSPAVNAIITSDLERAKQTAALIASACGLSMTVDTAWRERGFGLLEGKPIGDKKMWEAASGDFDPPGAEPSAEVYERVRTALMSIPQKFPDRQLIAVVTHGGPVRSILKMLADGRLETIRGHAPVEVNPVPNCSILHLIARHYRGGIRWKIEAVNDVSHLADA
jgi:broad specificity phosphatase PhoE